MQKVLALLPKAVVDFLKGLRKIGFYALEPFDFVCRRVNGKGDFPPLYLRRYVGPLRSFESSGAEFQVYLKLLGKLRSNERVLDIGCGCGLMAFHLREFLRGDGKYVGLDIYKPAISWARKNLQNDRFAFAHIDVKNNIFNPSGKFSDNDYRFPFESGSFDFILLKSVFTHMSAEGVNCYLSEISRLLSPQGRALVTFFLLDAKQKELAAQGKSALDFSFGGDNCKWVYKNSPESAIAYSSEKVLEMVKMNNMKAEIPLCYGTWSGREDGVSFQDMLVVRHV